MHQELQMLVDFLMGLCAILFIFVYAWNFLQENIFIVLMD